MMRIATSAMLMCSLLWMEGAQAQAWLPEHAIVHKEIDLQPDVRAARARVAAAQAQAQALRVGQHEILIGVIGQVRNADENGRTNRYNELEAQVSRGFRWPAKVALDRRIGTATVQAAELRLDDARHQSARRLLRDWMAFIRAADQLRAAERHLGLLQRERAALQRRVQLGDAARKDLDVLEVEVAQAQAQRLAGQSAAVVARDTMHGDFPRLPIPERAPNIDAPLALPDSTQVWIQRIIERSHEIGALEADAEHADAKAARASADRLPDPIIGLRTLRERGGAERALGVTFSMPIGGRYRSAVAASERANALAIHGDAAAMRRDITREAEMLVLSAATLREQWQAQRAALQASEIATRRLKRGWELGEFALSDWLLAQRTHGQIAMAEAAARADAEEARLKVLVDSHELWHDE